LDVELVPRGDIDRTSSARASKVGGTALALRHEAMPWPRPVLPRKPTLPARL
jgi:hypothetical protein